jgi:hypothetical protein
MDGTLNLSIVASSLGSSTAETSTSKESNISPQLNIQAVIL